MKLFDSLFKELDSLLEQRAHLSFASSSTWPEADANQLIFRSDAAYELGGGGKPGLAGLLLSSTSELIGKEGTIVYGPDLAEIKSDAPYARISLVEVDADKMGDGKEVYSAIRKIDYVRYHISVEGAMFRISPLASKESIILGKKAYKRGLSFQDIGASFIKAYHQLPSVKAAKIIFITDPAFPYDKLETIFKKTEDITKALDHLVSQVGKMDCQSCGLQKICSEVEALCKDKFPHKE